MHLFNRCAGVCDTADAIADAGVYSFGQPRDKLNRDTVSSIPATILLVVAGARE